MSERRFKVSLADLLIYIAAIAFFLTGARFHWPDVGSMIWLALYGLLCISCCRQILRLARTTDLETRTRLIWIAIRITGILLLVIDTTNSEKYVYYRIDQSQEYSVTFSNAIFRHLTRSVGLFGLVLCLYSPGIRDPKLSPNYTRYLKAVIAFSFVVALLLNATVMAQVVPALVQMAVHGIDISNNPFIAHYGSAPNEIPNYYDNHAKYYFRSLLACMASVISIVLFLFQIRARQRTGTLLIFWFLSASFAAYQLLVIYQLGLAALSPSWQTANTLPDIQTMIFIGLFTAFAGLVACLIFASRDQTKQAIAADQFSRHPRLLSVLLMLGIVIECYLVTFNNPFTDMFGNSEPSFLPSLPPSAFSILSTILVQDLFAAIGVILLIVLLLRQLSPLPTVPDFNEPEQSGSNALLLSPVAAITLLVAALSFAHLGFAVWFDSDLAGWFFMLEKLSWLAEDGNWLLLWVYLALVIGLVFAAIRIAIQSRRRKAGASNE